MEETVVVQFDFPKGDIDAVRRFRVVAGENGPSVLVRSMQEYLEKSVVARSLVTYHDINAKLAESGLKVLDRKDFLLLRQNAGWVDGEHFVRRSERKLLYDLDKVWDDVVARVTKGSGASGGVKKAKVGVSISNNGKRGRGRPKGSKNKVKGDVVFPALPSQFVPDTDTGFKVLGFIPEDD